MGWAIAMRRRGSHGQQPTHGGAAIRVTGYRLACLLIDERGLLATVAPELQAAVPGLQPRMILTAA
ncbi:hypothetical protein ACIQI8_42530 [Streptomyces sp. NPDC092369]|uniref:hypothetical protein n=1 Tax=Streptomyces sp. NPDC092369 TaxID=3366015 RepID=UPI0037F4FED3